MIIIRLLLLVVLLFSTSVYAENDVKNNVVKKPATIPEKTTNSASPATAEQTEKIAQQQAEKKLDDETLRTLLNFVELQDQLRNDIKILRKQLGASKSDTEKADIKAQLEKAQEKLQGTTTNLENIAAGTDLTPLRNNKEQPFNLQKELFSLLEPALKEMKQATSDVRLKSKLHDEITYYEQREPIIKQVLKHIAKLNRDNKNKKIRKALIRMNKSWTKQLVFIQSELQAKRLQLSKLELEQTTFADKTKSFFKDFFQRRGWTLIQALLAIIGVLITSRLLHKIITHLVRGYRAEHRSVQLRVIDLMHRFITIMLLIIGPMIVFYLEEDWVLFSLGILLLVGMGWTLRHAIPRYWKQLELFLNVGTVREGERLMLDGIPWRVKHINVYTTLENPLSGLRQRIVINELVDMRSRPAGHNEPWFPCKKGDWVILNDGIRGKITGLSIELVQLVQRGGALCTYKMSDFLSQSPVNLSKNFRIKETIGISYKHQKQSTTRIISALQDTLNRRLIEEGHQDALLNLRVEFEAASESSLDLVVIADFKGDVADIYNRLRRAIQRWSVDACTENGWEIPYPQLTLHTEKPIS